MIFVEQNIKNLFIIKPEPFKDNRGMLRRNFCKREFNDYNLFKNIKQTNISENKKRGTLRGFHYQLDPYGEDKIISCINGSIYNVVIDLRKKSSTYLKCLSFNINMRNRISLYVPKGCANAYLTLEKNTWILYYHSEFYTPGHEAAIRFDDPFFDIKWPIRPKVISKKDSCIPDFKK